MCKNWENGAKWLTSRKSPRVTCAGLRIGLRSESRAGLGAWPVAFDGGPYQTLLCSWVQFSGQTSRLVLYKCALPACCYRCTECSLTYLEHMFILLFSVQDSPCRRYQPCTRTHDVKTIFIKSLVGNGPCGIPNQAGQTCLIWLLTTVSSV